MRFPRANQRGFAISVREHSENVGAGANLPANACLMYLCTALMGKILYRGGSILCELLIYALWLVRLVSGEWFSEDVYQRKIRV